MPFLSAELLRDLIANRPAAGSAGRIFFSADEGKTYRDNGTSWDDCSDTGAVASVAGKTGAVTLAEADISGLATDLAAKAPLASPTFTGTPAAPTPATADNSTKIATTAYVQAQAYLTAVPSQPLLVSMFYPGTLANSALFAPFDIPSNLSTAQFAANFANSVGKCGTNPTASVTLTVAKNGTTVGTIVISTSGVFTFATSGGTAVSCSAGDEITVTGPSTADSTLANVRFTLAGTR